uniref:Uncharacterized protein n=1 Tax=Yersinia enterocolitica W22703 TaxID=913028 RepID=F4MVK7_YEREN|nr:unknown protein [Yersinia enterocolitica W22703]
MDLLWLLMILCVLMVIIAFFRGLDKRRLFEQKNN